jgi:hypothetical protein
MSVPCYISENKSDMRGIKHSWYAIEEDGAFLLDLSEFRGVHQENRSADEWDDGV